MHVLHSDWDAIILMDVVDFFSHELRTHFCLFVANDGLDETKSVHFGVITFNVDTEQSVVLSEPITDSHHVLRREAIKADVNVDQSTILHESFTPLPGRLGTLKLVQVVSLLKYDFFFPFQIVREDCLSNGPGSH